MKYYIHNMISHIADKNKRQQRAVVQIGGSSIKNVNLQVAEDKQPLMKL